MVIVELQPPSSFSFLSWFLHCVVKLPTVNIRHTSINFLFDKHTSTSKKRNSNSWAIKWSNWNNSNKGQSSQFDYSLFIYTNKTVLVYSYLCGWLITYRQLSHIHSSCYCSTLPSILHRKPQSPSLFPWCWGDFHTWSMFISQQQYIRDILVRFNVKGIKESVTPLSCSTWLTLIDALNRLMPLSNVVWLVACNIFVSYD